MSASVVASAVPRNNTAAAPGGGGDGSFVFPPIWSFPPFFTEQPVEVQASRQRTAWVELIRSYSAHHRLARISLHSYSYTAGAASSAAAAAPAAATPALQAAADKDAALVNKLFRNDAIQRALSPDFARRLLDCVAAEGWGAWEDASPLPPSLSSGASLSSHYASLAPSRALFVLSPSRRLPELADALWSFVESSGESGALMTLYELASGDAALGQVFYGVDTVLLLQAVRILEGRGRAAVIPAPVISETGVKFLA